MNLQLIYDGEALANHEINPKDLSVALLGIDYLLNQANQTLNKDKTELKVRVKASFETGCFKINFTVVQNIVDQVKALFTSSEATAAVNAIEIIGAIAGLVKLLKFLKGQKPEKIHENDDGSFTIYKDKSSIDSEKFAIELYKNYKLRESFEQLVSPLLGDGIDDMCIKSEGIDDYIEIKKNEVDFFKCPEVTQVSLDEPSIFETSINIINLSFKEENKWYVNDGQSSFYVIVEDSSFLRKIDENTERFGKGDILRVQIRREQYYIEETKKLKTENYIEKVISHQNPSQQLLMDLT